MESQSSPKSPKFMTPSEVFKMRKKKRLLYSPSSMKSPLKLIEFSPLKCLQNIQNSPLKDSIIISPFKSKRLTNSMKSRNRNTLFPIVKKSPRKVTPSKGKRQLFNYNKNNNSFLIDSNDENANLEPAISLNKSGNYKRENCDSLSSKSLPNNVIPIDWSIKTKLRFTSSKPFPWRGNFRASEEATGITSFVRCIHSRVSIKSDSSASQSSSSSPVTDKPIELDTSRASILHQNCLVWSHPNLPWLCLFPRMPNHTPGTPLSFKPPTFSIVPNTPLADALHSDWCNSVKSLYQLLKTKQCPYFYVCANSFTVLFRASGIGVCDEIQVMVTPTTDGLRKMLTQEGIQFTMPFQKGINLIDNDSHECSVTESVACDDGHNQLNNDDDDEESNVWLQSLGLSQEDFPSISQSKRKKKRPLNSVSRSKSMVLLKGMTDSQLFINFLINSCVCIPKSGPFSGVPPTLLSPIAFHGATLQPLKLQHSRIDNDKEPLYNLEITGPVLTNSLIGLIELFKETQDCGFKCSLINYEPTVAFTNCNSYLDHHSSTPMAFATENLKDCGLQREFLNNLCAREYQSDETICEIVCNSNGMSYF